MSTSELIGNLCAQGVQHADLRATLERVADSAASEEREACVLACWNDSLHPKSANCRCGECIGRSDAEAAIRAREHDIRLKWHR